ncbi:hypothetical protein NC653_029425 [Populus alba x Populus x berolinensis]|uniref:Uncharacterized protein n=1 Tax=Populus alba x Populus x berolinensis TaxID=444605 RepID=A0AAD6M2A8_9ROSI|nr:hypothetical protein NC653_029425 [Populus alba x Populus x berolinensis]
MFEMWTKKNESWTELFIFRGILPRNTVPVGTLNDEKNPIQGSSSLEPYDMLLCLHLDDPLTKAGVGFQTINLTSTLKLKVMWRSSFIRDIESRVGSIFVMFFSFDCCCVRKEMVKSGINDTAAGVLGRYDPRPVQPDSLFPVFSVTKGNAAGRQWLIKHRDEDNLVSTVDSLSIITCACGVANC